MVSALSSTRHAPQVLKSIEQALTAAEQTTVNEVLSGLEGALSPMVIAGATPPVRRAIVGCFTVAFAKAQGARARTPPPPLHAAPRLC